MNKTAVAGLLLAVTLLTAPLPSWAIDSIADAVDRIDTALADLARLQALKLTDADIRDLKAMRNEAVEADRAGDTERAVTALQQVLDILGIE